MDIIHFYSISCCISKQIASHTIFFFGEGVYAYVCLLSNYALYFLLFVLGMGVTLVILSLVVHQSADPNPSLFVPACGPQLTSDRLVLLLELLLEEEVLSSSTLRSLNTTYHLHTQDAEVRACTRTHKHAHARTHTQARTYTRRRTRIVQRQLGLVIPGYDVCT